MKATAFHKENGFKQKSYSWLLLALLVGGGFYFLHFPQEELSLPWEWTFNPIQSLSRPLRVALSTISLAGIYAFVSWHLILSQKSLKKRRRGANLLAPLLLLNFPEIWLHPSLPIGFLALCGAYHTHTQLYDNKKAPYTSAWSGVFLGISILIRPVYTVFLPLFILALSSLKAFSLKNTLALLLGFFTPLLLALPFLLPLIYQGELSLNLMQLFEYHPLWRLPFEVSFPLWIALASTLLVFLTVLSRLIEQRFAMKEETLGKIDSTLFLFLPLILVVFFRFILADYLLVASFALGLLYSYSNNSSRTTSRYYLYTLLAVSAAISLYSFSIGN